ncbi:homocysteine S-methyltransferase [uncultured Umboniibacter sp.]|uniref:homocysteine S-methyltransferase n=1 Tax=uncultured Umboniibacter sp. TaxID=1798917 RepID=UPI0026366EFF|nr:homocysteine S-methyltransferase [uncultured Umboniibacter sp.]
MNSLKLLTLPWQLSRFETPTILVDGGLAIELQNAGARVDSSLWTAKAIINRPEYVIAAHQAYLNAGAKIISTASYQASLQGLVASDLTEEEAKDVIRQSVELAEEARMRSKSEALIAASIGPYGAYLAGGEEYTGAYHIEREALLTFHLDRLNVIFETNADLLAIETIPSCLEIDVLVDILRAKPDVAAWISLSCKNDHQLADGSELQPIIEKLNTLGNLVAVGVNCCAPDLAGKLAVWLRTATEKPLIIYPNLGQIYDATTKKWSGEGGSLTDTINLVAASGTSLVGGCCEVDAKAIAELNEHLWRTTD